MINENLINEYSGTNFSVTKVNGVSKMQYASDEEHWIENREEYGSIFMGDGPQVDPDNFYYPFKITKYLVDLRLINHFQLSWIFYYNLKFLKV